MLVLDVLALAWVVVQFVPVAHVDLRERPRLLFSLMFVEAADMSSRRGCCCDHHLWLRIETVWKRYGNGTETVLKRH